MRQILPKSDSPSCRDSLWVLPTVKTSGGWLLSLDPVINPVINKLPDLY